MKQCIKILIFLINESLIILVKKNIIRLIIYVAGSFNISLEDIKDTWFMDGPVANDRWTLEHFRLTPEIGKMKVWFSDMFNGNEQLSKYKDNI